MRASSLIASAVLVSGLLILPAHAGLLGSVVGAVTGGSSGSSTPSSSSSSSSGGGSTTIGVPGVVTVSTNQNGGTNINASVLGGGGSTANVGLSSVLGGNSNLGVTLPGTGTGLDSTIGSVTNTVNGITGNGGVVNNLLGSVNNGVLGGGGLPGLGGGGGNCGLLGCYNGGGGDGGGGGLGGGGNGGLGGGGYGFGGGGAGSLAFMGRGACTNDATGLARLLQTRYDASMMQGWNRAGKVRLVPIRLCAQLKAALARAAANSPNINFLRGLAAADPGVSAMLARGRYNTNNVIGVSAGDGVVSVYVF